MKDVYVIDESFDKKDFTQIHLNRGEYENCTFNNCNFSDFELSEYKFIDCLFKNCNLSLANINGTAIRNGQFLDCKMLGLRFETCHEFGLSFSFENCQLDHSSFYKLKLKKTMYKNTSLLETDFAECDLSNAIFDQCNLSRAIFDHSILEHTDFSTSYHYAINPEINRISKAKFGASGVMGLLLHYDIEIDPDK